MNYEKANSHTEKQDYKAGNSKWFAYCLRGEAVSVGQSV